MGALIAGAPRFARRAGVTALLAATMFGLSRARPAGARPARLLHASLLSSEPAMGAVLTRAPERVRLVFSEPIEASMSALAFVAAPSQMPPLVASADPHDVHALIAWPGPMAPGHYAIAWRVVSADGHRVGGRIDFTIASPPPAAQRTGARATRAAPDTTVARQVAAPAATEWTSTFATDSGADRWTRVLRAAAVTALLALAGLSLMIALLPLSGPRPLRTATGLGVAATVLLALYTVVWSVSIAGDGLAAVDAVTTATSTTPGALEVARVALALLSLWALGLAHRPGLAAAFALVATVISGASGHPAVMSPAWAIPAKSIHLAAGAIWLGGLIWLVTADRHGARYVEGARRISSLAMACVLTVVATGILQTALILPSFGAVFASTYGRVVLLKVAGLGVLVLFGAFHRRIVPRMETTVARRRLRRSVRAEIVVMLIVSALGGLLATIAPPR